MDPLIMIGLYGVTLIGIAGVVRAARSAPDRQLDPEDEHVARRH